MKTKDKQFFTQQSAAWLIAYVNNHIASNIDQFWFARLIQQKQA